MTELVVEVISNLEHYARLFQDFCDAERASDKGQDKAKSKAGPNAKSGKGVSPKDPIKVTAACRMLDINQHLPRRI